MRAIDRARSKRRRRSAKARPEAKIKTKPRQRGRIQGGRPFDFQDAFYHRRLHIGFGRTRAPARPPPRLGQWVRPAAGARCPSAAHRSETGSVYSGLGNGCAARAPFRRPPLRRGKKAEEIARPQSPNPAGRPSPPHSTGFHGQKSLKAEGRALAPIDRSEKNRERFGRWAVSAATALGDRNPTGTPQAGPAPAERFGALCPAAGKRRAGRPSPTPSPSPSRPGGPAAPLAVEPIGLGEVEPKRSGERPCGKHPRPPAKPAASPQAAAIDSAKQAQPDARSNG